MKNLLSKCLFIALIAVCLGSTVAEARHHGGWGHGGGGVFIGIGGYYPAYTYGPGYYSPGYYGGPYAYSSCGYVRGHYNAYGYWIPPHRVCWY